jgi:RHS repeat-associated protein
VNDTATPLPVVVNENGPDGNISYAYGYSLISASATGLQSFYQFDGLGSVATVTDGAASQKASYVYEPWGNVIGGADLLGTKNKFKFTGEAVDPGTGLAFLRARYYDSSIGRFLSEDRLAALTVQPGSMHRYAYAHSNPTGFVDPNGYSAIDRNSGANGIEGIDWEGLSHSMADFAILLGSRLAKTPGTALTALNELGDLSNVLGVVEMYRSIFQDASNPSLTAGMKIGRASDYGALFALGVACPLCGIAVGVAQALAPNLTRAILDAPTGIGNVYGTWFFELSNWASASVLGAK